MKKTRMHSSGMHTAHLLTVSQHALHRGGVFPGGSAQEVSAQGDVWPGGCLPLVGGIYPSMQWGRHPPVDRQTPAKT